MSQCCRPTGDRSNRLSFDWRGGLTSTSSRRGKRLIFFSQVANASQRSKTSATSAELLSDTRVSDRSRTAEKRHAARCAARERGDAAGGGRPTSLKSKSTQLTNSAGVAHAKCAWCGSRMLEGKGRAERAVERGFLCRSGGAAARPRGRVAALPVADLHRREFSAWSEPSLQLDDLARIEGRRPPRQE
jgi:hypothetical protein